MGQEKEPDRRARFSRICPDIRTEWVLKPGFFLKTGRGLLYGKGSETDTVVLYGDGIMTERVKKLHRQGRDVHIGEDFHGIAMVLSLANQAPYFAA